MYFFEVEILLNERIGRDCASLVMSYVKEDPVPMEWPIDETEPSPWDTLAEVEACWGVGLPLFAP